MAIAWRFAARREVSALGTPFPPRNRSGVTAKLVTGSVLFGAGWALAGLCPGPALASLGFGGVNGAVFLIAMLAAMVAAPKASRWLDRLTAPKGSTMDIRALTPTYAVSPQIDPEDLPAIKAAGYTTVIDNRPDGEIPPHLHTEVMEDAAKALGLTFVANPVIGGAMTPENVATQRAAIEAASGPVFAYCASGNRSSVVWAVAHAGLRPADELIGIPARFGYQLEHLRPLLEAAPKG
nr:TIGR01244 family sulfur transferase [Gemmobacter straminiformis]